MCTCCTYNENKEGDYFTCTTVIVLHNTQNPITGKTAGSVLIETKQSSESEYNPDLAIICVVS